MAGVASEVSKVERSCTIRVARPIKPSPSDRCSSEWTAGIFVSTSGAALSRRLSLVLGNLTVAARKVGQGDGVKALPDNIVEADARPL